jgi:hypothetical protein
MQPSNITSHQFNGHDTSQGINMMNPNPELATRPGGFMPPTPTSLSSPATSSAGRPLRSSKFLTALPHPRRQSIRPSTSKEFTVREYATSKLSLIARRFVKKFSGPTPDSNIVGYNTFDEVCSDFDAMINILWLSGTRKLDLMRFPCLHRSMTDQPQLTCKSRSFSG